MLIDHFSKVFCLARFVSDAIENNWSDLAYSKIVRFLASEEGHTLFAPCLTQWVMEVRAGI